MTYSLVVDDLNNGGQSAIVGVVAVDQYNAANLNEAPVRTLNQCFAHCDGDLMSWLVSHKVFSGSGLSMLASRNTEEGYVHTSSQRWSAVREWIVS